MSKGILNLQMIGRFGNQAMQYLHARAIAERDGLELRTPRWVGEKIFQIEPTAEPDYSGDYMRGYHQNQESAIYTLRQVREWFRFKPEIEALVDSVAYVKSGVVGHLRRGDMIGCGYPVVAVQSYYNACHKFGIDVNDLCFVTDAVSDKAYFILKDFPWLPDFYIMANSKTLLRANSSFSFVAGMLNPNRVLSPVIDGLEGGKEHLCDFVDGNWPRLASLEGITDMHVQP